MSQDPLTGVQKLPFYYCCLIKGAKHLKDFRPISLVGDLYKLLAKVLANRLKRVMGTLVSDFQHAL